MKRYVFKGRGVQESDVIAAGIRALEEEYGRFMGVIEENKMIKNAEDKQDADALRNK